MTPREPDDGGGGAGAVPPEGSGPVPDQDGPHDVPDEVVIEKTLPTVPDAGPA